VQSDAKARVEGALDHAFAMHFQNFRRRKTAHQCLPHAGRVRAGFGCKQQRLGHGLNVQRHDDLVGYFGRLPVAIAADQRDVFAHQLENCLDALEHSFGPADHDRQRGVFRADFAARHGRVKVVAAKRIDFFGEFLRCDWRDRAHVNDDLACTGRCFEPCRHAAVAEQHRLDIGRVGHHRDDDVSMAGHVRSTVAPRGAAG